MHSATLFPDARLEDIHARLLAHYGPPPPRDLWDPLTQMIYSWLEAFDGVGVKTSAAVVNFSTLRRRAMCVDSHHLRIAQRLGFVNKGATAREAEARIMEMAPVNWSPAMLDDHHSLIKLHGQKCCNFADPHCPACPLRAICQTGSSAATIAPKHG